MKNSEYDISNINLDGINERCDSRNNRHSPEKIGQVKWLLEKRMPVVAISEYMRIATSTVTQIRRNETHSRIDPMFPVDLMTEDDLEAVKAKVAELEHQVKLNPKKNKRPVIKR